MSLQVQVAVVGGGIVGCSLLYCLAKQGWTDSILLEKHELTSGSTWHAAGNTTFFGHYPSITRLYANSVKVYQEAEKETGQSIGFHAAGSIRIANSQAELEYYKSLQNDFDNQGIVYEVVSSDKIESIHPLLNTDGILGAAYTPTDGHLDASSATHAVAKAARQRGAEILRNNPLLKLEKTRSGWFLHLKDQIIKARHVVLANSFWARETACDIGLDIPVYAVKHQAIITESIEQLENFAVEVPTIRDAYGQYNMRQEGNGLLGAVYEPDPEFWAVDGIPDDFNQELFEPNLERLENDFDRVMERVPAFGEAGIKSIINGPICYSPDALPMIGPVENHPGLWLATGFCIGIGTGGGSAEFLAHWMANEKPPYELPMVYASRFRKPYSLEQCRDAITKIYRRGYSLDN